MKRWVVYHRAIPTILAMQVNSDTAFTMTKDGLGDFNGMNVPKVIITMQTKNDHTDNDKALSLNNLLARLLKSSQIVGYKSLD